MEIDLRSPKIQVALRRFTKTGAHHGCLFCKGRMIASVKPGDRIVMLKGTNAGYSAVVSKQPGWSEDEFLARFDFQPKTHLTRIHYKHDEFAVAPVAPPPKWLCSFSIDDLCAIEGSTLMVALNMANTTRSTWTPESMLALISTVRVRRLPVSGSELWPTLAMHGFHSRLKRSFCAHIDFSLRLLRALHGRAPIKKRRVEAMSIGRYMTPAQLEHYGPSPGLTS
jgi:hypothetical protein